ncbi:hypothetical protein [Roseomonas chloroacetimidivorans]|uniref:hypothetical protein n=1 Tax=Roseomonas chloroacetimidivorans TaxID=1766656 RepID=UPI003C78962E
MRQYRWRTEPDGVLTADADGFRLVVHKPKEVGGHVHFLVLRREAKGEPHSIIGSGSEENVRDAMKAAARMVERYRTT